jgi:hypothetical protein
MSVIAGASDNARRRGAARALAKGLVASAIISAALLPGYALDVGPKSLPLTVGVPVEIPVSGSLDVHTNATELAVEASATGDLREIQDRALDIARACVCRMTIARIKASTLSSTASTKRR